MKKLLILIILIIFILSGVFLVSNQGQLEEEASFEVVSGMSFKEIGSELEEQGMIKSSLIWQLIGMATGKSNNYYSGHYRFEPGQSMMSILDDIYTGQISLNYLPLTIPEGSTAEHIAEYVEDTGLMSKAEFLQALQEYNDQDMAEGVEYKLEGYLFPETYYLDFDMEADAIIGMLLNQFDLIYNQLEIPSDFPYSQEEHVILASIVEKESQLDHEINLVAGVFLNRLNIDMALQSCATVNYVLKQDKLVLSLEDIALDSPYNTYMHNGLPPGPVSNPGQAALEAVIYPEQSDYFYFVAAPDGTHKFSETYEEHEYWSNLFYGE